MAPGRAYAETISLLDDVGYCQVREYNVTNDNFTSSKIDSPSLTYDMYNYDQLTAGSTYYPSTPNNTSVQVWTHNPDMLFGILSGARVQRD